MSASKLETHALDSGTVKTSEALKTSQKPKIEAISWSTRNLSALLFHSVRNWLLGRIKADVSFILLLQRYRSPELIKIAQIISATGAEAFYIASLGCFASLWEVRFSCFWGVLLSIVLAICNLLKNIFYLPRPPVPPVKVFEIQHDWGFPSTHSATAVSLGGFIILYVSRYLLENPSPAATYSLWGGILAWILALVTTRIYLGVHSMTDVWGGIAMGVGLLWAYFPRLEKIEQFLLTPFAPLKLWLILLGIILFHPRRHPTTSYYTSITISSLGCGLLLGYMWLGPLNPAYRPHLPVHRMPHPLLSAILRCVLGSLALFGMKMVTKKLMYRMLEFLCTTFRIPHVSHREALIEAQPSFTHMGIFDQLHRALELVQEEKKAKAAEKAANGHVYNGAGHSGTKVTNGVNGHTYTHPHEYNGTGNKCENGSHENGGQRKRRDSGRHSRTENGSHSNNLADYPLLSPEELARHKVNAELALAQKPGFVLDLDVLVKVVGFADDRLRFFLGH